MGACGLMKWVYYGVISGQQTDLSRQYTESTLPQTDVEEEDGYKCTELGEKHKHIGIINV